MHGGWQERRLRPAACLFPGATSKIGCFRPFLPAAYSRLAAELRPWASNNTARTCGSIRPAEMIRNSSIFSQAPGKRHAAGHSLLSCYPPCTSCQKIPKAKGSLAKDTAITPHQTRGEGILPSCGCLPVHHSWPLTGGTRILLG